MGKMPHTSLILSSRHVRGINTSHCRALFKCSVLIVLENIRPSAIVWNSATVDFVSQQHIEN